VESRSSAGRQQGIAARVAYLSPAAAGAGPAPGRRPVSLVSLPAKGLSSRILIAATAAANSSRTPPSRPRVSAHSRACELSVDRRFATLVTSAKSKSTVYIRSRRKAISMMTPTGVDQANDPLHQTAWSRNIQPRSTGRQRQAAQPAGTLQLFRIAR
jgi:hypothetical protein